MSEFSGAPRRRGLPANFELFSTSTNGLFSVRGLPKSTHLHRIYLNGLHLLFPFWITNETTEQLSLDLVSPADCSIKFQRDNANWSAVPSDNRESYVDIVNGIDDASKEGDGPDEVTMECNAGIQKEFCEVFNQMDGIKRLDLAPHETLELVLLYVSNEPKTNAQQTPVHSRRPSFGQLAASVNGTASGSGTSDTTAQPEQPGSDAKVGNKAGYQYTSNYSTIALQAMSEDKQTAIDRYSICLRTSFCKSVLEVDPPTSRVYIDDCVVGKLYERILAIKNASEIGLDWSMTVVESTDTTSLSSLQLLDKNMDPLNDGHLSAGESSTMLIRYTPQSVGEFLCRFLIENKNDPSNQRYWVFRARVSQRQKPKLVELLSEPYINFGDCTSGVWNYREISLRNVSETPIAMRFRVEGNTSNLKMKSSVKAWQDPLDDGNTIDGQQQQPVDASQLRNHTAETPASNRSDAGLADDSLSESANANDGTQDEATSEGGGWDSLRSQDADTGDTSSLTDRPGIPWRYSQGEILDDGSTQSDILGGGSDLQSTSTGKAAAAAGVAARRESSGPLQDVLERDRRMHPRTRLTTSSYAHQPAQFDEVLIKPGSVRTVVLSLLGNPVNSASVNAGQFDRLTFTFFCEYAVSTSSKQPSRFPKNTPSSDSSEDRLSLPCTVNMCTPFVRVSPPMLDFGSVDVGMLKTMYLQIENLSQVEATVQCKLESKVINCMRTPLVIPPLQSKSVRVDIYPRRINARYRKQIIVRNKHNHLNDNVVEVRSVHVDQRRMAFHNLFYKTLVPQNEQNFVDFGTVPYNSRVMRKINLQNLCCCPVTIGLSTGDGGGAGTPFPPGVDGDLESTESLEANRSSSSNNDSDGSMIAMYTVAPLIKDGAVTQVARDVAKQLPLLERQAVMHSNVEAFKERSGILRTSEEIPAHSNTIDVSAQPRTYSSKLQSNTGGGALRVLQPGIFVDKAVERGHACLVPFSRPGKPSTESPVSIEYLDVPVAFTRRQPSVRIQEHGNSDQLLLLGEPGAVISHEGQTSPPSSLDEQSAEDVSTTVIIDRAMDILDQIISNLDTVPKALFSSAKAEDEYVRRQVDLHKYIDLLVESGFLQPASQIVLPASGTELVVVMLRPSGEEQEGGGGPVGKPPVSPRFDANLYFRLIDRPSDLLPYTASTNAAVFANSYQLPVRRFLIQASLCHTELELGQKSINVGNMQVDEASRKYLVIKNRAETPLMYAIRKTGSIASGDIQFVDNNRYGVVRGFDSRKVVFVFKPSLNGVYNEQMSIANVLNAQGGKTAIIKAIVRRPSKFYIQSLVLEFGNQGHRGDSSAEKEEGDVGILSVGVACSDVQILTIKNMTPTTRYLAVMAADILAKDGIQLPLPQSQQDQQQQQLWDGMLPPVGSIVLDPLFPPNIATSTVPKRHYDRETEEKIETLEQKMKIAVRKEQPEKIEKYRQKLAKLRNTGNGADAEKPSGDEIVIRRLGNDRQVTVTLPPLCAADIPLVVVPRIVQQKGGRKDRPVRSVSSDAVEAAVGYLVVHEEKDKDNVKLVTLKALVRAEPSISSS
ncbi:hypothetical protein EV175_000639 [Coemansia sp. RSA 1933]|nr:hypothetical protein EV175_000639 [Coemansia sp. RSA 1933]